MSLTAGSRLGSFEVVSVLGAGGMGGAAWTGDDYIVYVHNGALWQVPRSGGEPKAMTGLMGEEISHGCPHQWRIDAVKRATGERQAVLSNASMPLIGPGNLLFFYRDGQLLVSEFDPATLKTTGIEERR